MKKELWIRLKKYRFGNLVPVSLTDRVMGAFGGTDAFTRAFAAKVAKRHGWTNEFAFLAVREYKKFIYLGVISHYDVTPSKVIDQVWHEHQLFTKGYREFCQDVLGKHFDHSPELLPLDDQNELFNAQYLKTIAFYEHEFGSVPPQEIWGQTKFDRKVIKGSIEKPVKKRNDSSKSSQSGDIPIFMMFNSDSDATYAPVPVAFNSGQGGEFGGGGASGSWNDTATSKSTPDTDTTSSTNSSTSTSSCSSSSCGGGGGGD